MNVQEILQQNQFRITSHRCELLEYFQQSKRALTHANLEEVFKGKMDRVSIYRILHSFSDAGILCKLVDSKGNISYVFNKNASNKESQHHPHFKCKTCNDVVELPKLPKAYIKQLGQLNIDHLNMLAEGTCKQCEKDNKEHK